MQRDVSRRREFVFLGSTSKALRKLLRLGISMLALFLTATFLAFTPANAQPSPIEIHSVAELSCTSVEITFTSSISKKSTAYYMITAVPDSSVESPKIIKKIIKTKATGLITAEVKNLNPKVDYKFSVAAKTNKAKLISSEAVEYSSFCNLMDVLSKLPADWGNPKPTLAAPAFTLSSSSETRTVNTAASGFTINSTGGAISSFAINATPAGMSFNTITGALAGTPTTVAAATVYTITATNASGSATRAFTFTVNVAAPAFTLSSSSETRTVNTAATGFTINSTGGAIASFGINSTPAGMSFNTTTGELTGTPTTVAAATVYTVTATNATGSATQTFTLTVSISAPAFTLSSSSETRTVNTAATGFTINSTGGDIASFSINATPAGMSFNTATGALTGTPTTVASSTVYTITATNASGSATQTFTLTVSAAAVIYNVGDTGPGGGKIFYKAATPFTCGPTLNLSCTYLEAAPPINGVKDNSGRAWSTGGNQTISVPGANELAIGGGYKNSLAIVAQSGNVAASSAAVQARAYTGGSLTDWYLPSKDELTELWTLKNTVGGFENTNYWSSSEFDPTNGWRRAFQGSSQSGGGKSNAFYFRPIRAF